MEDYALHLHHLLSSEQLCLPLRSPLLVLQARTEWTWSWWALHEIKRKCWLDCKPGKRISQKKVQELWMMTKYRINEISFYIVFDHHDGFTGAFQHYLTSLTRNSLSIQPKLRLLLIIHDLNHRDTALRRCTSCCASFEWQVCEEVLNHCSPLEFCPWPFLSSWLDFDLLLSSEGSESSFSVTNKTMKKPNFTIHLWEKSIHRCIRLCL